MEDCNEESGLAGLASNTDSISKGVFVFKRGKKRLSAIEATSSRGKKVSRKRKKSAAAKENDDDFTRLFFGQSDNAKFRHGLYNQTWQKIEAKMKELQKQVFDTVVSDVINFCQKNSGNERQQRREDVLPTCALVTGVNLPDHKDFFKLLGRAIKKSSTKHVATVKSSDCSTIKLLVKKILAQLQKVKTDDEEIDEEESDEDLISDEENEGPKNKAKFIPTLTNFLAWYENQYGEHQKAPLVIVFEDFEGFSPQALQDLISNLKFYNHKLPFILIFGVATTVDVIHRSLPHATTSKLGIQSFSSAPSIHLLSKFVESLVMDTQVPFKLGARVLKVLLETFSFHDLSVRHFLMGLKCCLLEHFSCNESSVLCCLADQRKEAVKLLDWKKMSAEQISRSKEEGFDLKNDLDQTDKKTRLFNCFVAALHSIVCQLPRTPLGKNFHHVYNLAMSEPITQSHEYREAFQFLKMSERVGLMQTLQTFSASLNKQGINCKEIKQIVDEAKDYLEALENMESSVMHPKDSTPSKLKTIDDLKSESPNKKLDRFKLQEVLLEQAREKKLKSMNPYEQLREKIMTFFHATFTKHLNSMPSTWLWHDVFFYDQISVAKDMLMGAPRNVIQLALKAPRHYIKAAPLQGIKEDEIPSCLPDLSIAYKLHLECGKMINLFDWLQCWMSIVNEKMETNDGANEVDSTLQARFSRTVSELQFLGFIKPSKRKTDHVERLTF